jgi:hypothetical protein
MGSLKSRSCKTWKNSISSPNKDPATFTKIVKINQHLNKKRFVKIFDYN